MPDTHPSSPVNLPPDSSNNLPLVPSQPTVPTVPSQPDTDTGNKITNLQYTDASGTVITESIFVTTDPSSDVQIFEDLSEEVMKYYDDTTDVGKLALISQIKAYADDIKCTNFQGKGSIDDYTQLFQAAAQIANDSSQMQLDVDIEGFNEFASAADDLSALFNGFIVKMQNISIIDDTVFLTAVANALGKIANLSKVFGKFKETIIATSTVKIPKSSHDTSVLLQNVTSQVNCAMNYISHFVDSSVPASDAANLSDKEKSIITDAVNTINNWNILCDQGISIAMSSDPDIISIKSSSQQLKQHTQQLSNATSLLKSKLLVFNIHQ
jgi:hypothetical protein